MQVMALVYLSPHADQLLSVGTAVSPPLGAYVAQCDDKQ